MFELIENDDYRKELSKKAQEKSLQFDGNVTEKREFDIYKQLLGSKKLP